MGGPGTAIWLVVTAAAAEPADTRIAVLRAHARRAIHGGLTNGAGTVILYQIEHELATAGLLSGRSGEAHDVDRDGARGRGRAGVVDHVGDDAPEVERHGQDVVEQHTGGARNLEGVGGAHRGVGVEEAIDAQAPAFVAGDVVADLVCGEAVDAGVTVPRCLIRHIVRHLVLEEDGLSMLAIPDHLELLVMPVSYTHLTLPTSDL